MNSRRKIIGVPIILWIIIAALIGTISTATIVTTVILNGIHNGNQHLSITWNQQIPASTLTGQTYTWSINTDSSINDSGIFAFYLKGGVPLTDPTIINLTVRSVAGGPSSINIFPPSQGGFAETGTVADIPEGSHTAEIIGSWTFNSNAPLTTYTIQVSMGVGHRANTLTSNTITTSTILNS
jgi:hypothetical protein